MYVLSEGIQPPALLTMWGSLGMKMLNKRVGGLKSEEWSKCDLNKKRKICRIGARGHWKKRA